MPQFFFSGLCVGGLDFDFTCACLRVSLVNIGFLVKA